MLEKLDSKSINSVMKKYINVNNEKFFLELTEKSILLVQLENKNFSSIEKKYPAFISKISENIDEMAALPNWKIHKIAITNVDLALKVVRNTRLVEKLGDFLSEIVEKYANSLDKDFVLELTKKSNLLAQLKEKEFSLIEKENSEFISKILSLC